VDASAYELLCEVSEPALDLVDPARPGGSEVDVEPGMPGHLVSVILVSLLRVVVDQLFDVGLDDADFGEDLAGGGGPSERFRVGVPRVDVGADLGDQDGDGGEGAASDGLAGDDPEPDLDLVQPRGSDRGEVERDVRVALQPGPDLGGVVRGQVVQDDMDLLAAMRSYGLAQEPQEVLACAVG
jgi:hypothetical protein